MSIQVQHVNKYWHTCTYSTRTKQMNNVAVLCRQNIQVTIILLSFKSLAKICQVHCTEKWLSYIHKLNSKYTEKLQTWCLLISNLKTTNKYLIFKTISSYTGYDLNINCTSLCLFWQQSTNKNDKTQLYPLSNKFCKLQKYMQQENIYRTQVHKFNKVSRCMYCFNQPVIFVH